jgi:hypothetical protein
MKRLLPFLLLIALGLVAWWLWRSNTGSTLSGPLTEFSIADTSTVDRIFIADMSGGTADLVRTGPATWTVNGLPANARNVQLLLKTFLRVEVRSPVPKAAEANVLKVMSSTAKKVEIYTGGKTPAKIWYVGHATQDHYGTYMLLEIPGEGRSTVPYVMAMSGFSGFLSTRFFTTLDDWRSTVVLDNPDLTQLRKVSLRFPGKPEEGWTVTYGGGNDLALFAAGGASVPMDTAAVKDLFRNLRDQHFENFERRITRSERDSVLASPPAQVLELVLADGRSRRIPFWTKAPYKDQRDLDGNVMAVDMDRQWALLDDTSLVVVQRHLFDHITLPIQFLKAR